jgi:hypothetical protein
MSRVDLPVALTRYIADAMVDVVSWSANSGELVLRISKEIGPETGRLKFRDVGYVHLPPRFEIATIGAYNCSFPDYPHLQLETGEFAVAFQDVNSDVHLIVACSVEYEIDVHPVK